jgi:hypothetical protein
LDLSGGFAAAAHAALDELKRLKPFITNLGNSGPCYSVSYDSEYGDTKAGRMIE